MELTHTGTWVPVEKSKKEQNFEVQNELYKKYKKLNDLKPQNIEKQFEVRRKN